MKTFEHDKGEWQCKCTLKEQYNWDHITSGRVTITEDEQVLVFPFSGKAENFSEAVQMAYPMGFWCSEKWMADFPDYKCPKCKVYPHRIIPNPYRR